MNKKDIILKETEDGSRTYFIPSLDEHYHSTKGALTESQHIFIKNGFNTFAKEELNILEVGFGTGLNTYLTAIEAINQKVKTNYTTLEKYPLSWDEVAQLDYEASKRLGDIHLATWNQPVKLSPYFTLHKIEGDFKEEIFKLPKEHYDLVYFDAFAPEKQPDMWQENLFQQLSVIMKPQSRLTSYCVKGVVKRMLRNSGFKVQKVPGPPHGKREILCATKN